VESFLTAVRSSLDDPGLQLQGLVCLDDLAATARVHHDPLVRAGCVEWVTNALSTHPMDVDIVRRGLSTLAHLTQDSRIVSRHADLLRGVVPVVLGALQAVYPELPAGPAVPAPDPLGLPPAQTILQSGLQALLGLSRVQIMLEGLVVVVNPVLAVARTNWAQAAVVLDVVVLLFHLTTWQGNRVCVMPTVPLLMDALRDNALHDGVGVRVGRGESGRGASFVFETALPHLAHRVPPTGPLLPSYHSYHTSLRSSSRNDHC
jgi:hypothetical protein